jgi:hypothetical protein
LRNLNFFALIIACFLFLQSKAISLSDSSQISLLTCSPGSELYSCFGHTGIRVTDYRQGFDVVFNYGTFDFEKPGFYTNFVKGLLVYMVDIDRFENFKRQYEYEERSVTEQVLNLTTEQKQQIFTYLDNNVQPANRDYRYDFFWDNCATRPRDVFENALGTQMQYSFAGFDSTITMHDMLRLYVHDRPWVDFGFDLILGMPCEIKAKPRYQMFLPDYLAKAFATATVNGVPFVTRENTILTYPKYKNPKPAFSPLVLVLLIVGLLLLVTLLEWKTGRQNYRADFILHFFLGLLGVFFLSVWLFTEHYSTKQNLNVLWLLPSHLFISFFLLRKQKPLWLSWYFLASLCILALLVVGWKFNPQPLNIVLLPLLIIIIVRHYLLFKKIK